MAKGCISLIVLLFVCGSLLGQTAEGTWFRQGIYQLEKLQVSSGFITVSRYSHLRLSDDSLTQKEPAMSGDVSALRILLRDTLAADIGCYIIRPNPDSIDIRILYQKTFGPGMIGFLPGQVDYREWDEAVAQAQIMPKDPDWIQSRMYLSDSLVQALKTRPSLSDISKRDLLRVLKESQAAQSHIESLRGTRTGDGPSGFAMSQMLRQSMNRLFIDAGYNPFAKESAGVFTSFIGDAEVQALLAQLPQIEW